MKNTEITKSINYIGVDDNKIDLFEGQYKVPNGMSYNSYIIFDEYTAIIDTVDKGFTNQWLDNISLSLNDRLPDYLIIQHMEPDHSANIYNFIKKYPETKIVTNAKALAMITQFFDFDASSKTIIVENGQIFSLGKHKLQFIFAPMVHWPEVMMTYVIDEKILFSADAFGKFGVFNAQENWVDEARRYYIGIVGKYGLQVQNLLKKAACLDISMICPLHGPLLKENLAYYLKLYDIWSSYSPEEEGIVIAYTSIYGNTEKAVEILASCLKGKGAEVRTYDLARTDMSFVVSEAFRYSKLVLATTTYNADIFPFMREFINHLTERNYQNRTIGIIENGSWVPTVAKIIKDKFAGCKNINFTENIVTIKSAVKNHTFDKIKLLSEELCNK